jgi:hypothetical protein
MVGFKARYSKRCGFFSHKSQKTMVGFKARYSKRWWVLKRVIPCGRQKFKMMVGFKARCWPDMLGFKARYSRRIYFPKSSNFLEVKKGVLRWHEKCCIPFFIHLTISFKRR